MRRITVVVEYVREVTQWDVSMDEERSYDEDTEEDIESEEDDSD